MPNTSKLGAYIAPTHDPSKWQDYLRQIQPPLVRILMPGPQAVSIVSQVHALCPQAKLSLRWWDVDDGGEGQKMGKLASVEDARARARADYDTYMERYVGMNKEARSKGMPFPATFQVLFNALNEPPSWKHELRPNIVAYNQEFTQYAEASDGPNVMVGEFAVGHPEEWPPVWDWFQPVIDVMDSLDVLSLHEYWQPEGPMYEWTDEKGNKREDWGALAGRYLHCPFSVPIAITECGVDGRIYNKHQPPDTGYLKFMQPEFYAGQVGTYLAQLLKDERIIACTPFITDFADKEWASFNTLPALPYLVKVVGALNEGQGPASLPTTHLPSIIVDGGPNPAPPAPTGALDPRVLMAILQVESGGEDNLADGLKIRFEPRIFKQYIDEGLWADHFQLGPKGDWFTGLYRVDRNAPFRNVHENQASENAALRYAMTLNAEGALDSTSMGAAQIMGFNAERVGWPSALAMFEDLSKDEAYHLIAFYNFMLSDPNLMAAVQAKDFRTIAKLYNGTGNVDSYSKLLQSAYSNLGGT